MKTLLIIVLTLVAIGLFAVGFAWSGSYNIAADVPHTRPVHALLEAMRERSIEAHSTGVTVPDLTSSELIRSGAGNYDAMCAGCHLEPGTNESEMSIGLNPSPPNFTKAPVDNPAEAFWAIKHGIKASGMPAWGKSMQDEYIWGLVAFLNTLPRLSPAEYNAAIAASGGHSHDDGELQGEDHAHEHGPDHHALPAGE